MTPSSDLWAKGGASPRPTVASHCRQVAESASAIIDSVETELAAALADERAVCEMPCLLEAAALLHDLGKINSAFQQMLDRPRGSGERQPVRHEIVSALMLMDDELFGPWFRGLRPISDIWPIVWAIAGHHLKMGDPQKGATLFALAGAPSSVVLPTDHRQVIELLQTVALSLGGSAAPKVSPLHFRIDDDDDRSLEARVTALARVPNGLGGNWRNSGTQAAHIDAESAPHFGGRRRLGTLGHWAPARRLDPTGTRDTSHS